MIPIRHLSDVLLLLLKKVLRRGFSKLFSLIPLAMPAPAKDPIDVVIPVTLKDLNVLPLCIEGVRRCVTNSICKIYIVSHCSKDVVRFCNANDCVFVDEDSVLGIKRDKIGIRLHNGVDRSGWLFQQFIKLSGKIGECDCYLCIDADHVLIAPHTFLGKRKIPVFYMSDEYHAPYYEMIKKLLSTKQFSFLSYVSHKMLFDKNDLIELQQEIEKNTGLSWIEAIVYYYDRGEMSGFSEFELYGNFKQEKKLRHWRQKSLIRTEMKTYDELRLRYSSTFMSLTFPDYLCKQK